MHNVYLIENIIANKERKKLVKDVQSLLLTGKELQEHFPGMEYKPGKRTLANMHLHPDFCGVQLRIIDNINKYTGLNLGVHKSWIVLTKGQDEYFHTHANADWAAVYYIRTLPFFNNGTVFKKHGFVKAPQNSALIFPSNLEHSVPTFPFGFSRYTWGMDLTVNV